MELNDFIKQKKEEVLEKIKKGEPLTALDNLVLQGKYEVYDPQLKAYKQIDLKDYFLYIKSLNQIK